MTSRAPAEVDAAIEAITSTITQNIPTEKIYLFGSYAYGEPHKDSDYDIFVIIPDGGMRPLEAMRQIHHALFPLNLEKPIDVLASYQSAFEEKKQHITLERTIDRQGILLYERK
ncbi:MAG: nucleotidyltransferase domain-containing protein [Propionibacteriaceae bacterium]|jgi:predicted nucleotidyltransferase|nr:nucleotidyltransferase domain-containing protein [Propionibacteriaceae bacterium]